MNKNLLPRKCINCESDFIGGARAWYCPLCRAERKREADRRMKQKRKTVDYIPLGTVIQCEICGKDIIKNGGNHKYCIECGATHLKKIDNKQSLEWKRKFPEKYNKGKRAFSKKRHTEEGKQSGIKYINWDKESRKWVVIPYYKGKQYKIGRFESIEEAKRKLDEFVKKKYKQ